MNPPSESEHSEPPPETGDATPPLPEDAADAPLWNGQPIWAETEGTAPTGEEPGFAALSEEGLYPPAELTYPVASVEGEQDPAAGYEYWTEVGEASPATPEFDYAAPYEGQLDPAAALAHDAQASPKGEHAAVPGFEYIAPSEEDLSHLPPEYEYLAPIDESHPLPHEAESLASYEAGYALPLEPATEATIPVYEPAGETASIAPPASLADHPLLAPIPLPPGVPDDQVALLCEGLERFLGTAEARVHVLRGVSLRLEPGYVHAVVGPSGCGKSSLLYILGLLDRPDAGRLVISGRPVANLDDDDLSRQRNVLLGFIFQFHFLLQDFTAQENIMIPMRQLGVLGEAQMRERANYLLDAVGLGDKGHRASRHLSGGEQQRVAIARALANDPQVILADEPTGNLDTANSTRVFSLLTDLVHRENKALLLVTHNPAIAEACDWTHTMRDGLIVDQKYAGVRH